MNWRAKARQRHLCHPRSLSLFWATMESLSVKVVLHKSDQYGYGFSLLGVSGLPHVIYDIVEHSPAECELVRAKNS